MKVAIIGANGQLGSDLVRTLNSQNIANLPLTHSDIDVTDAARVDAVLESSGADVVVNTAAFHKVEQCEREPDPSFRVNAIGPWNLANTCRRLNAILVHFSTDYVFDGQRDTPYGESDLPRPQNVYGVSKLAGEGLVALTWQRSFVVRTCGLYGVAGSSGKGGNFVETMLKKAAEGNTIKVVRDQVLTPTFTGDLAIAISQLIRSDHYGLYHVSAEGQCSWYEFAKQIFELQGVAVDLKPVSTSEFPSPVRRPAYSVLSKQKLHAVDIHMPPWQEGLKCYLAARSAKRQLAGSVV